MSPARRLFIETLTEEIEARGGYLPPSLDSAWLNKWFSRAFEWSKHKECAEFVTALIDDRVEEDVSEE